MPELPLHDLSSEPLLGARVAGTQAKLSLAELLATLGQEDDVELTSVQPHQQHPWHAFVVQLAAILLHRAGATDPRQDATTWQEWMREATGGREAWCLVVPDLAKAAFMQPPVPEGTWKALREVHPIAGELDVLVTAKNHDVKARRMERAAPEHWAHVLIALQTGEGFSGRGNYGIARMNGGFGSRPCLTYAPSTAWGPRVRRDVLIALEARSELVERYGYGGAHALLWLTAWDGTDSLRLPDLDPYFVETCRRIRLRVVDSRIVAHRAATTAPRVEARELKGAIGDLWTPIKATDAAALTVSGNGLGYRLLRDLLFSGDWERPPAMRLRAADGDEPVLIARVLVRGQGKTEGLHERIVRIARPARGFLLGGGDRLRALDELSQARVEQVREVQRRVLKPAVCVLIQGAPDRLDLKDDRANPFVARHDRAIDEVFFETLWDAVDLDAGAARVSWDRAVLGLARDVFWEACESVPLPSSRRYRVLSAAEATFEGSARKLLPDLFATDASPAAPAEEAPHG